MHSNHRWGLATWLFSGASAAMFSYACGANGGTGPTEQGGDAAVEGSTDAPTGCSLPMATTLDKSAPRFSVTGDPAGMGGLTDISLFYPAGSPNGFAAYTNTPMGLLETRFARSTDGGGSWTLVSGVNTAAQAVLPSGGLVSCGGSASCPALLVHELPTFVADPSDPDPNRRLKIISDAYLEPAFGSASKFPTFLFGYFALQTSADGQSWSSDTAVLGWSMTPTNVSPPLPPVETNVDTAFPELADCALLLEPGMAIRPSTSTTDPGAIDLSLSCIHLEGGSSTIRVVLLRSTDHAKTFRYVGVLLSTDDATCLGSPSPSITAADLFYVGAKEYLLASRLAPNPVMAGNAYLDCLLFAVDDSGAVTRDAQGHPTALRQIATSDGTAIGSCSYAEGATQMGYVGNYGSSLPSSIFVSGIKAP